jgi:hypothetical protein
VPHDRIPRLRVIFTDTSRCCQIFTDTSRIRGCSREWSFQDASQWHHGLQCRAYKSCAGLPGISNALEPTWDMARYTRHLRNAQGMATYRGAKVCRVCQTGQVGFAEHAGYLARYIDGMGRVYWQCRDPGVCQVYCREGPTNGSLLMIWKNGDCSQKHRWILWQDGDSWSAGRLGRRRPGGKCRE